MDEDFRRSVPDADSRRNDDGAYRLAAFLPYQVPHSGPRNRTALYSGCSASMSHS
jgi:hypothetical protein